MDSTYHDASNGRLDDRGRAARRSKWDDLIARDDKAADGKLKEYLDKGPKGQAVFFLHHTVIEYAEQEVPARAGISRFFIFVHSEF